MKTISSFMRATAILLVPLLFFACDDEIQHEYTINEPIYMSKEEFKNAVKSEDSKDLTETGKIYFYNDYILVNEKYKGIHVFDNSNPSSPQNISFINIPGNIDMAIKDDILYADSYTDLVAIDFSDVDNISEQKRFEDLFSFVLPPTNNNYRMGQIDSDKGIVIGWEVKRVSEEYKEPVYYPFFEDIALFNASAEATPKATNGGTGKAGSMARFMIYENTLYTLNTTSSLNMFDISDPDMVTKNGNLQLQWGIETIFVHETNLFFGARDGMYIYDITNPFSPQFISEYSHFMSCDPVVVDGDYAYITLRAGNFCGQNTSQLDVVDLSDLTSPTLLKSYGLYNPYGLGKDGDLLFVCDGTSGLKIYNASDPLMIGSNLIKKYTDLTPYDVIPLGNILVTVAPEGLYQYDYSDINNIQLLSSIEIPQQED